MRNVAEMCFSANVPKARTGKINDFSYWDWVLGSYWYSYLFQVNDHMTICLYEKYIEKYMKASFNSACGMKYRSNCEKST